jgi:hypothetical protein
MAIVTIKNQSGFDAKVKVGYQDQWPRLVPAAKEEGTTFDLTDHVGQVYFQARPLGPPGPARPIASIVWPYNPPRDMTIVLKVNNNTGQYFFEPRVVSSDWEGEDDL